MLIGRGWPEGEAQHLLTAIARATDAALRCYEDARLRLERAAQEHAVIGYLHGCEDMAIAFIALHRAMRLADALVASLETTVDESHLPPENGRSRLRRMRNAIDHRDKPIKRGDAGIGKTLALNVREHDSTIDDDEGTLTLTHVELGDSIRRLHSLVVDLTNHPEQWTRVAR
jgi:hypothetical protein